MKHKLIMENWKKYLEEQSGPERSDRILLDLAKKEIRRSAPTFESMVEKLNNNDYPGEKIIDRYINNKAKELVALRKKTPLGSSQPDPNDLDYRDFNPYLQDIIDKKMAQEKAKASTQTKTTVIDKSGTPPKVYSMDWDKEKQVWTATVQGPNGFAQGKGEYNGNLALAEKAAQQAAQDAYYRNEFIKNPKGLRK